MLPEPGVQEDKVTRLILCTGKIYYDLVGHPDRKAHPGLAVARVELLYPFPESQVLALMGRVPSCARWCGCRRSHATWAPAPTCSPG